MVVDSDASSNNNDGVHPHIILEDVMAMTLVEGIEVSKVAVHECSGEISSVREFLRNLLKYSHLGRYLVTRLLSLL
jgi:hypothetical protein